MSNLNTKINKFIKQIEFNDDGSIFVTVQQEFEIALENGTIKKMPHESERVLLAVNDPKTKEVMGDFVSAILEYWRIRLRQKS